jgi:predicted AlkP superfamily phosphohydrolase/phosphomutase
MIGKKKLYLIGIDSAPLWIIKELCKNHGMNGFETFFNEGIFKDMKSTLPPLTPTAWSSIYTGLEPREHGVMDFFCVDSNYEKVVPRFDAEANITFWDLAADKGLRSLVVTPPVVLKPSSRSNVDMITGWPMPPKFSSDELKSTAMKFGFDGEPPIEKEIQNGKMRVDEASRKYAASIKSRSEMSKHLIESNDYDIVFVCFTETDRIQHYSLNKPDWEKNVAPLYKNISDFLEWVINYTKSKNEQSLVMLVSDHGAQPIHLKFLLNAWLINNGYAALKPEVAEQQKHTALAKGFRSKLMGIFTSEPKKEYIRIHDYDFEMKKTSAFTSVSNDPVGMVWINDDRFAKSVMNREDRKNLKTEIMEKLDKLKTDNDEKLVAAIYDGDEYYRNAKRFIAPDILFIVRDGYIVDVNDYSSTRAFLEPEITKSGDHTMKGIFGIVANNYSLSKSTNGNKDMDVYDVKPMIMEFLDL